MNRPTDETPTLGPIVPTGQGGPDLVPSGTVLCERFRVEERLGSGGFAVVYRGFDLELQEPIALKVLRPERLDAVTVERVKREVLIARRIDSRRLLRVYDLREDRGCCFLPMELIEGGTLQELMRRECPLAVDRALELAEQILLALHDLHEHEVLHRDIKPSNILFSKTGELKLGDFGLARPMSSELRLTATGATTPGTAAYRFPEVGNAITPAADLYSFGVVLFEMLTGRLPFDGFDSLEVTKAHLGQKPPDVRQFRPEVPKRVAAVVRRLLEKKPGRRFVSAEEALHAIRGGPWPLRYFLNRRHAAGLSSILVVIVAMVTIFWRTDSSRQTLNAPIPELTIEIDGSRWEVRVSSEGRLLWMRDRFVGPAVGFRYRQDGSQAVALFPDPKLVPEAAGDHVVWIHDGRTGVHLKDIKIDTDSLVPFYSLGFADQFGPAVKVADWKGDGRDELFVTLVHKYWPSLTILIEPDGSQWPLLIATGHHKMASLVDVDSDGEQEALLVGTNNGLGYRGAVAAIDLPPPGMLPSDWTPASSPDFFYGYREVDYPLLWYALLPYSADKRPDSLGIVSSADGMQIQMRDELEGSPNIMDLDGFLLSDFSTLAGQARNNRRLAAYKEYRSAVDLRNQGLDEVALEQLDSALRAIKDAGDKPFEHWLELSKVLTRISFRDDDTAPVALDTFYQEWMSKDPDFAKEVAFQVGKHLHLEGELREAVGWYQRVMTVGASDLVGRSHWEVCQKQLLALMELNDFTGALNSLTSYRQRFQGQNQLTDTYLAFLQWKMGNPPSALPMASTDTDLVQYWNLELRRAQGERPERLLVALEEARKIASETPLLLDSLKIELLAATGRESEARNLARTVLNGLTGFHIDPILIRFHTPWIRERAAAVGVRDD